MMSTAEIVEASIRAWENNDADALAACLTEDFFCIGQMPQQLDKKQFVDYMKSIMRAFPDWKFNAHILNTRNNEFVEVEVHPTGVNSGELVVLGLPPILPTGKVVTLPQQDWE